MVDLSEDALFREIQEDIQRDRLAQLWKRYGSWIIALAIVIVLGVAAREVWRWNERREAESASARYLAALELSTVDIDKAQQTLRDLAASGPAGYALLSRLHEAGLDMRKGDFEAAATAYREIEKSAAAPAFRDLALILGGYATLAGSPSPDVVNEWREKLTPLAADTSPWRFSARELLAITELRSGNRGKAKELFEKLAAEADAPVDMRSRAKMAAAQLANG